MSSENRLSSKIYPRPDFDTSHLRIRDEERLRPVEKAGKSSIDPAYYRSRLNPDEQACYSTVVNGIRSYSTSITMESRTISVESIRRIVRAVHLDHPELFWVNFWRYQVCDSLLSGKSVQFEMLLDQNSAVSVSNTLNARGSALKQTIERNSSDETIYHLITKEIIRTTEYLDTGDVFQDHTVAGPILNHTAVCEGISKLFLYYCRRLNMPCAIIEGSANGAPHAWNMVEINGEIKYIDVTSLLETPLNLDLLFRMRLKRRSQMIRCGYRWKVV